MTIGFIAFFGRRRATIYRSRRRISRGGSPAFKKKCPFCGCSVVMLAVIRGVNKSEFGYEAPTLRIFRPKKI